MVTGHAFEDAVARAKVMPGLGVGLHLVLVEGKPALPASQVPDLVDGSGRFRTNMAAAGVDFFFRPAVRRQLGAEIEAQFARFAATGLPLDHVNAHKHFHLHPTVAALILRIGRRYGLNAARAPVEPHGLLASLEPVRTSLADRIAAPWARRLQHRLRQAGLTVPDRVLGLAWTGAMAPERVQRLIAALPLGLSELYLHPATGAYPGSAPGYAYAQELAALTDGAVREEVARRGIELVRFADVRKDG